MATGSNSTGQDGQDTTVENGTRLVGCEPTEHLCVQAALIAETQARLLHDLNNVLVAILLNVQIIEWKMPSYSRVKRNLHEVERSAQRGGLLVNRLRAILNFNPEQGQKGTGLADIST
jgi:hypothetical protein